MLYAKIIYSILWLTHSVIECECLSEACHNTFSLGWSCLLVRFWLQLYSLSSFSPPSCRSGAALPCGTLSSWKHVVECGPLFVDVGWQCVVLYFLTNSHIIILFQILSISEEVYPFFKLCPQHILSSHCLP